MRKLIFLLMFLCTVSGQIFGQERTVSGKVISSIEGEGSLPGVAVTVSGTTVGTSTDLEGNYSIRIPENGRVLIFQFVGLITANEEIGDRSTINVTLEPDLVGIDEVVVTALGISRGKKSLNYASQDVSSESLNLTGNANIKTAVVGKIAGIQLVGQAGSKLGEAGRIRIRGAVSMTSDGDPLYVVDGVPTSDPNVVDINNVESVTVLKGPNATALYGQRAEYGVILITSKKGSGRSGISAEIHNSTTFESVAYLPNYQNKYGQGYNGEAEWTLLDFSRGTIVGSVPYPDEWSVFNGEKYIYKGYADESWGPEFDGSDYIPWYALWPDSPYYGETAKWVAQPDNIRDFYDTGVTINNSVAINGSGDNYSARVSFTKNYQSGILPYSKLNKNQVNANIDFSPTDRLRLGGFVNYSNTIVEGDFDDSYGNQTTGTLNSWWARDVEISKLRELIDLETTNGYHASWNFWGPDYGPRFGTENGAFWYNPYFWLKHYKDQDTRTNLVGKLFADYSFSSKLRMLFSMSTNYESFRNRFELPFIIANSSDPHLYNTWNSGFGNYIRKTIENNYIGQVFFKDRIGKLDIDAFAGAQFRTNSYDRFDSRMELESKTQGLTLPDVFTYSNTKMPVTSKTHVWNKKVLSSFGRISLGYKSMIYIDGTYRRDWSSALPTKKNGYGYPSIGGSFIFSELFESSLLSFGKLRTGWAQVGNDLDAMKINPVFPLSTSPYFGNPQMYTNATLVDRNIEPALNTSFEAGFDLKFLQNKLGLSFTYFDEVRENEIIPVSLSSGSGFTNYLTNAGIASRNGIEIVLDVQPVKTKNFIWESSINFGTSNPTIDELPAGLESMNAPGGWDDWDFVNVTHELGNRWGQLRGTDILRDDNGNKVINSATGMYVTNPGQYLGSVLPDFTGGFLNQFTLFNMISLSAAIDFQKGGNFFSLSEMWGYSSGILEETAENNDRGNPVRDPVSEGGGVHVTGVDENGNLYDQYVNAKEYFVQFNSNIIASEFIHDASYIKLRDINLSFHLPDKFVSKLSLESASIGFVARNIWLIALSKDNVHGWDPSELSKTYGENAQMPGTRSFGFNVNLTF